VDDAYRSLIDQLIANGARYGTILNPPELLKHQSEKIPPAPLMRFAPKMMVVHHAGDLLALTAMFKNDSEIVSKPLHLAQSIGVAKHSRPETPEEWDRLLSDLTKGFTQPILIQEFLPGIHLGEVRLWFAGKTLVGVLRKHPKNGDFRVLIDEGSRITSYQLTPAEHAIAEEIGKTNASLGILMAAVDLIDGKICDYNITSPGLLMQLEEVNEGKNLARIVLDRALEYRAPGVRE
jgi:glutathione synthase